MIPEKNFQASANVLVHDPCLVIVLGIVNESVQLRTERGLSVLSHQLLEFDN